MVQFFEPDNPETLAQSILALDRDEARWKSLALQSELKVPHSGRTVTPNVSKLVTVHLPGSCKQYWGEIKQGTAPLPQLEAGHKLPGRLGEHDYA